MRGSSSESARRSVRFNVEGKVFVCYNCAHSEDALPSVPQELPLLGECSPRYLRRVNFQHERYPYLAFIPAYPSFAGIILNRFADLESVIVEDENGWHLTDELQVRWFLLGNAVRGMSQLLVKRSTRHPRVELVEYTKPERYGYQLNYRTRDEALKRAEESRDAFLPLFAMLTFVVALYKFDHTSEFIDSSGTPEWCRILLDNHVNGTWLEDLRLSQILDFTCRRVGVILDFSVTRRKDIWKSYINLYIRAGIPVYIIWGLECDRFDPDPVLDQYRPTDSEFMRARNTYRLWRKATSGKVSVEEIGEWFFHWIINISSK